MKKIIDGKRYDTEKAEEIDFFWNGLCSGDFRSVAETLYKSSKGAFFLYGKGGAMTKYAESHGDAFTEGEDIIPLTESEAFDWLECCGKVDSIEKYFADRIAEA